MFNRIRKSISHPKYAFLFLKDKFTRIFLYILILATVMSLPIFFVSAVNPTMLFPSRQEIGLQINPMLNNNIRIENDKLIDENNNNHFITIGSYNVLMNLETYPNAGIYLVFEEEHLVTKISGGSSYVLESNRISYKELGYNNLEFDISNKNFVINLILDGFTSDKLVITSIAISSLLINYFDLLILILLLAFISSLFKVLPLKFSDHFKINTYIVTIYAFVMLILNLFGLLYLDFIAIVIAYIYQNIAYRSIRIIRKVEVKKKDE